MSIRIDNDQLTAAAAAQAGKAEQSGVTGTRPLFGTVTQSAGSDSVEMSSIASNLISAGAAEDAGRAQRVSQLAAAYANGSYQADSLNISRAMIAQALSAGPLGDLE